jgi:polysaccharide deacetylase 2 family uncharacterized protein YibQ
VRRSFFSGFISGLILGVISIAVLSIYINLKEAAKVGKEPSVAEDYPLEQSSEPELEAIADQEKVEKQKTTDLSTSTLESFENSKSKEHEKAQGVTQADQLLQTPSFSQQNPESEAATLSFTGQIQPPKLDIGRQNQPINKSPDDLSMPLVDGIPYREEFVELPVSTMILQPAIQKYGAPAVDTAGKPVISIVLIDDQNHRLAPSILEAIPLPVAFAVPSETTAHKSLMRYYRNQGFEVVALVDYRAGAKAQDVEVVLSSVLANITDAVAVMESVAGTVQMSRETSTQTSDILKKTGHGLILYEKGLNTGLQYAMKIGVPAKTIYRMLDNQQEDEKAIRRFLDGAAFRARQHGHAIVVGHVRAITLSALAFWNLQERSKSIVKVPLSQVLLFK